MIITLLIAAVFAMIGMLVTVVAMCENAPCPIKINPVNVKGN